MREPAHLAATVLLLAVGAAGQSGDVPPDLVVVPAGEVRVGRNAAQLEAIAGQLHGDLSERRRRALRQMLSELGTTQVSVPAFYLNRWQVTNEQYRLFVRATGHRFPFHWWKVGKPGDYASRRSVFRAESRGRTRPDVDYWEANWGDLPSAIPEGREKYPVNFVSWRDASAFASWAGMRLPTEAEWLRAAAGESHREFLAEGAWDTNWFDELKARGVGSLHEVGAVGPLARGPFGHEDMVGNVWEWLDTRYEPLVEVAVFQRELADLRRRVPELREDTPRWLGKGALKGVLKGGSYLSRMNPVELRISARAPLEVFQTVEAAGLRLAKSLEPGRDLCRRRIEQEPLLLRPPAGYAIEHQIGVERYDLDEVGLIRGYHTVSVVPTKDLHLFPNTSLAAALDRMRQRPEYVGVLITTEPLAEPLLEPGTYSIQYLAGADGARGRFTFITGQTSVHCTAAHPDPSLSTAAPSSSVRRSIDKETGAEWLHFSLPCPLSEDSPRHLVVELSVKKAPGK